MESTMTQLEAIDIARNLCVARSLPWSATIQALFVPSDDPLNESGTPDQWLVYVIDDNLTPMEPDYVLIVVNAQTREASIQPVM
jgi:hypothetical protein